jgi:hypothetical protein
MRRLARRRSFFAGIDRFPPVNPQSLGLPERSRAFTLE